MQSPLRARRALPPMIALGLAASALTLGGTAAQADTVVDVTGIVTNAAGAPLANADVSAYVQSGNQFYFVDGATTDAAGRYNLTDLDAATRATQFNSTTSASAAAIRSATSFKISFGREVPTAELRTNPGYLDVGFGGARSLVKSNPVALTAGGATTANQAVPSAAGLVVRVTGPTGAAVTNAYADLYEAGASDPTNAYNTTGSSFGDDLSYDNPATTNVQEPAPKDGLVYVYGVDPGSYVVSAYGDDYNETTGAGRPYLSRFVGGNGTYADATPVTLVAGGFANTAAQLTDTLTPTEQPQIIGDSSFGSTLVADPGTWAQQQGTTFSYQWTRNGAPVLGATLPTYAVTKADKKKKIGLLVTAVTRRTGNFQGAGTVEFVGSAVAAPTSKVGEKSKVKAKRDGYGFDVTVKVAKKSKAKKLGTPKGKVALYTEDGELASKKAKLKGGKVDDLTPKRAFLGETKYVVKYLGGGKLGSDTATAKAGKGGGGKKKK